jgi:NitT/TauT family transport system substrate-binding protein
METGHWRATGRGGPARWVLGLTLAAMVATGCGAGSGGGTVPPDGSRTGVARTGDPVDPADGTPAPLTDPVTVRFGVFPNITHAPGLVALADDGALRALLPNADIQVSAFNSGTTAVEAMFSDAIDITYVGPNPAINAYAKSDGAAVRVISGSTSGGAFLVVRDGINGAADLRGTKIASPSLGNTQDVALRSWLATQGFATDTAGGGDVSVVPQENAQTLDTFRAGTIDGAWVPEPWATRLIQEGGAHVLVDERDLWPDGQFVTTQLMVATTFLEQHPDVVTRILLANIEAVDFVNANPDLAQGIVNAEIERYTTKQLSPAVMAAAWKNLTFTVDPMASSLETSARNARDLGLLEDPGDLAGLYDLDPLNGLLAALGRPPVPGLDE